LLQDHDAPLDQRDQLLLFTLLRLWAMRRRGNACWLNSPFRSHPRFGGWLKEVQQRSIKAELPPPARISPASAPAHPFQEAKLPSPSAQRRELNSLGWSDFARRANSRSPRSPRPYSQSAESAN